MIPRAMLAVAPHAKEVKGYPDPPGWGLGVKLTTPPRAVESTTMMMIIIMIS
jgi:hypothetical protein